MNSLFGSITRKLQEELSYCWLGPSYKSVYTCSQNDERFPDNSYRFQDTALPLRFSALWWMILQSSSFDSAFSFLPYMEKSYRLSASGRWLRRQKYDISDRSDSKTLTLNDIPQSLSVSAQKNFFIYARYDQSGGTISPIDSNPFGDRFRVKNVVLFAEFSRPHTGEILLNAFQLGFRRKFRFSSHKKKDHFRWYR